MAYCEARLQLTQMENQLCCCLETEPHNLLGKRETELGFEQTGSRVTDGNFSLTEPLKNLPEHHWDFFSALHFGSICGLMGLMEMHSAL